MNRKWVTVPLMMIASIALAQQGSPAGNPEEKRLGNFVVHQSVDFGYRVTDVSGANQQMYGTLVNLHDGPRLLDQTLSMQAPDHNGVGFDDLYVSSFGFGGDPNDVARARISKYKWYDFSGLFRRDWNYWNYNLLANPLNPSTSNPSVPITDSPHAWNTSHRMTDLSLTLAPQSRISVRTGYSRNIVEGPSFATIPEGTLGPGGTVEAIELGILQHNRVLAEQYQAGVDFKWLPRTTISYDQFIIHTHNDSHWNLHDFSFVLPDGTPANLGIAWDTTNINSPSPCPTPFPAGPPVADPTCSLALAYNRSDHMKTHAPTEQLSLQSQYFRNVDVAGRVSYSDLTLTGPFNEFFNGFFPDTNTRQSNTTGPMDGERIRVDADFSATVHVTKHLRIYDQFRFYAFRSARFWNSFTSIWTNPAYTSALNPAGNPLPAPADSVDNMLFNAFLGENTKSNEVQVHYDLARGGAMIGYRYRHTLYHVAETTNDFGDPSAPTIPPTLDSNEFGGPNNFVEVNSHSALGAIWVRPTDKLRANADLELTTADNFLTRISPRRLLRYAFRTRYQPKRRIVLSAHVDSWERRNGISDIQYNAHNRNFGATATFTQSDRLTWELAYNYNNIASNAFICYQTAAAYAAITVPGTTPQGPCLLDAPLYSYETFANRDHFVSATLMAKPIKRVTARLGYSIVASDGDATILNPLQPYGSLRSRWQQPIAELQIEIAKDWSAIGRWNYYDYNETNPFFGPTAPRNFHANLATVGVRYAF